MKRNGKKFRNVQAKQNNTCNLFLSVENLQAYDLSLLCAVMSAFRSAEDRFRATENKRVFRFFSQKKAALRTERL